MKRSLLVTALAVAISPAASFADEISKPKSSAGGGHAGQFEAKTNNFWWPDQLNLAPLRDHDSRSNPYGEDFDYAEEFKKLDLDAVKADLNALLTDSQDWWPADFGNYGPFFIRLAWHSSGTYRTLDGRGGGDGGQMRFDPLNSWPDNGNLDKARRLLWPIKQKYGRALSWGDLMIMAGTVGLENMGFKTYGFAGGRADDWEPDVVYWGPEVEMLASDREDRDGKLQRPLGATHMGLIYVNPEGPKGKPDPVGSAKNIRIAFGRMAMNDEETVALVAGGHTFGKMHGARKPGKCLGAEPGAAPIEAQGLGWKNSCGKGHSEDTTTSGLEGAWTQAPTQWTTLYLSNLLNNDWKQQRSPAGGMVWVPTDESLHKSVPDAHIKGKYNPPVMTTADLALKFDPEYRKISERFLANPEEYRLAFAKAWYKLTHRDLGPRALYLGNDVPAEELIWQDPTPAADYQAINSKDVSKLKKAISKSGLSNAELISTAWASAASYRDGDKRGGTNGARLRLMPQNGWAVNNPAQLKKVLAELEDIQTGFNKKSGKRQVSMADLIVLAGATGIENAAKKAGHSVTVPFAPGRTDASQAQTDKTSFALLEPKADAFRNYFDKQRNYRSPTEMMVDKADQLDLSVPEMTVLVGGMRVLEANADGSDHGVLTQRKGALTNDFFVNLLDMSTQWNKAKGQEGIYEGRDRKSGKLQWTATPVDLIFGSNSELRAIAEVYASDDAKEMFVQDFVNAWVKVMRQGRTDLN
ncbi:catalase/peroxidase HPI [Bacterioplanoides sp.]|uniref:catalase/peroxidase HPI n=1 Tax=Bacterioplanoides sp. TaxID=2066072 RepID=UPI003B008867